MPLANCNAPRDANGRELVEHGTPAFPISCYHDDLSKHPVPWHWHEELEAAVITKGCATVAVGTEKYIIHPGEGFFVNSGILHGCWDRNNSACRFHSLVFRPSLVGGTMDSVFFQRYIRPLTGNRTLEGLFLAPTVPWQRQVLQAIEDAWQACVQEPAGYEFQARAALSQLVFLIQSNTPSTRLLPSPQTLRDGERIKVMLQYIHDHLGDELSTVQIARQASISESECLRCFRAAIDTTPIQYVRQYRIQRASLLLTSTPQPIGEIAALCGFQDVSYFTKTFRELTGIVPSEYRRLHTPAP